MRTITVSSNRVYLAEEWGSRSPGFRSRIREEILSRLSAEHELSEEEIRGIEDLSAPPEVAHGTLCISHCAELGGFVISENEERIGFDVELTSRVRHDLALRIATADELGPAPSPAHLWTAKEAAYKALCDRSEPYYLIDVVIGNWGKARAAGLELEADTFQGTLVGTSRTVRGLAFADGHCVIALAEPSRWRAQE